MKKFFFVLILGVSLILALNPIKAIEENNGFIGLHMHKFSKGRIVKEVVIIDVVPNSPAWNAGIRIADRILKVNGEDVTQYDVADVKKLISGKIGDNVLLTLLTRNGIKDYNIKRGKLEADKIISYPKWYEMCGDNKKLQGESCFYHPNTYETKFVDNFKFSGPIDVKVFGTQKAAIRYQYEEDMRICQNAQDKAMCYMMIKQSVNNRSYAEAQLRQQQLQNVIQNMNHVNTNMELQNINQNLNNMNMNLQMLRY